MTDIYDKFNRAFSQVEAHAVFFGSNYVAKIAFKYPRDGAGRLTTYVHWFGTKMLSGTASGGGYDKRSAAVAQASRKLESLSIDDLPILPQAFVDFHTALRRDDGWDCVRNLENAGFTIVQVI